MVNDTDRVENNPAAELSESLIFASSFNKLNELRTMSLLT